MVRGEARDCRLALPLRWEGTVEGRFLTRPGPRGTFPFRIEGWGPGTAGGGAELDDRPAAAPPCLETVRAFAPPGDRLPRAGERIRVSARWEGLRFPEPGLAEWAGRLRPSGDWTPSTGGGFAGAVLALRGRIQERMATLWGVRTGPFVEALVLSRREHLDPGLRDAFALSGTAHLLAISGFHVGVVAGILFGALRGLGVRPRKAGVASAAGCWAYVLAIGSPHAAVRACLLLTLLALARVRGRPVVGVGALASVLLLLLVAAPGWLASVGFQLSFAGTAGLLLLRGPIAEGLREGWHRASGRPFPRPTERGARAAALRWTVDGVTAGAAATIPTLPLLAWHFDRLSLVGIPATIVLAPAVALAIPGILASLLASVVAMPLGRFLAGGTAVVLVAVEEAVHRVSGLPLASVWVSRHALVAAIVGGVLAHVGLRVHRRAGTRHRAPTARPKAAAGTPVHAPLPGVRALAVAGGAVAALLVAPLAPARGGLEIHVLDVGQGDAVAIRSPLGRWILVDAGPASAGFDAGERRVVPYLKRAGVGRLEALVLTHPHLDHIGGVGAVLGAFDVRGILEPSRPYGSGPYLNVFDAVETEGASWWPAVAGTTLDFDGARLTILHPEPYSVGEPEAADANDLSVVVLVRWGSASVLLTGDAPAEVEREILARLPRLTVLKLGHHGSRTSTADALVEATRPLATIVSAGEGNGFGHPHAEVLDRLDRRGIPVFRTDRDGDVRIRLGRDGSLRVTTSR